MGLKDWWQRRKDEADRARKSLEINSDSEAISRFAPELEGMDEIAGMAYVMGETKAFTASASDEERLEYATRLIASQNSWKAEGLTMPYWGNLVVLRNYQAEISEADK